MKHRWSTVTDGPDGARGTEVALGARRSAAPLPSPDRGAARVARPGLAGPACRPPTPPPRSHAAGNALPMEHSGEAISRSSIERDLPRGQRTSFGLGASQELHTQPWRLSGTPVAMSRPPRTSRARIRAGSETRCGTKELPATGRKELCMSATDTTNRAVVLVITILGWVAFVAAALLADCSALQLALTAAARVLPLRA